MDPGIPHPNPTRPFWLENNPLKIHRSTPYLPQKVDVVIIGSGISGAATAYHLLDQAAKANLTLEILVLEAREACSGATGRNGGHIIPIHCRYWGERCQTDGQETTVALTRFEHRTMTQIIEFVEKHDIDCELRPNGCVLTAKTAREWQDLQNDLWAMRDAGVVLHAEVWDQMECQRKFNSSEFVGGIKVPGCQLWPAKLVWAILKLALDKGLNLQTYTPVTLVTPVSSSDPTWLVHTPRGNVKAHHVVHCINAWMGHLVPELAPYLRPIRAQVIATRPIRTPLFWPFGMSFNHGFDYAMQRPDRMIIFGGMRYLTSTMETNTADDSVTTSAVTKGLSHVLKTLTRNTLMETNDGLILKTPSQLEVTRTWSGIMGFSMDSLPWVGPLEGFSAPLVNQYACGGFSGDGMPRAFQCAQLVSRMVLNHYLPTSVQLPTDDLLPAFLPSARKARRDATWNIVQSDKRALATLGITVPSTSL
ncbi:hypothetical protein IWQ61_000651 [Dispira simplex]|nr:hypothetical protein IWQ61_000651 [Dispira simplex]